MLSCLKFLLAEVAVSAQARLELLDFLQARYGSVENSINPTPLRRRAGGSDARRLFHRSLLPLLGG